MATKPPAKAAKPVATKLATKKPAAKPAKAVAPKRSSTKAAIKKPVAAAKTVTPIKVVQPDEAKGAADEINKRDLVERVSVQSGMKKGDARRAVDAVLGAIGVALTEGKDISAAPLGKVRIVRKKQTPNGELAVLRVKLKDPKKVAQREAEAAATAKAQS